MTQAPLPLSAPKVTLTDRLAAYFRVRAGEWINARELLTVAGFAGWRTRVSELRQPPYNMTIDNRTQRLDGYRLSFYRYTPEAR